jgi:RNA recognition motif-containing protein
MDRLSMSLDEIIKKNNQNHFETKTKKNVGPLKSSTHSRKFRRDAPYKDFAEVNNVKKRDFAVAETSQQEVKHNLKKPREVEVVAPVKEEIVAVAAAVKKNTSILNRLGNSLSSTVHFSNLNNTVEASDLEELCGTVGEVNNVTLHTKASDKLSKRTADITFFNKNDADNCVQKFNGLTLDGVIMIVQLADNSKDNSSTSHTSNNYSNTINTSQVAKPTQQQQQQIVKPSISNVKQGLFGTALNGTFSAPEQQVKINFKKDRKEPTFSVNLSNDPDRDNNAVEETQNKATFRNFKSYAKRGKNFKKSEKQPIDLDADLDNYLASR